MVNTLLYIYEVSNYAIERTCMQYSDMLQWFTQPAVAQRAAAGGVVVMADEVVHCTADSLCDEVLDADLGHLQKCFSDVAWVLVTSTCKLLTLITVLLSCEVLHSLSITFPHMECLKN